MTKGFLLVDQSMNTIIVPYDDFVDFFRYMVERESVYDKVHAHRTLKELDADVRKYLKGVYEG